MYCEVCLRMLSYKVRLLRVGYIKDKFSLYIDFRIVFIFVLFNYRINETNVCKIYVLVVYCIILCFCVLEFLFVLDLGINE